MSVFQFSNQSFVEKFIRKLLPYYFLLLLVSTICGAFIGYIEHHSFKMGDWLINYSAGFTRRGLFGEMIITLSKITSVNPGLLVAIFQSCFYAIYFCFSLLLLLKTNLIAYSALIFSPFIFTFHLNDFQGGYRKEIILFSIMSFLAYAKVTYSRKTFEFIFFVTLTIFTAAVLSHEMLAGFVPYLFIIYLLNNHIDRKRWFLLTIFSAPVIYSFLISITSEITFQQIEIIRQTLSDLNYSIKGGSIAWLSVSAFESTQRVSYYLKLYLHYLLVFGLCLVAFIPIYPSIRSLLKDHSILLLLLCSITASIIICTVALDWGRILYINLVAIFILSLIPAATTDKQKTRSNSKKLNLAIISILIIWCMSFRIPHCCGTNIFPRNFKELNIAHYLRPIHNLYNLIK